MFNSEKYKKNPQTITQSELIRSGWKWLFDVTLYDVCYELTQSGMVDGQVFTEIYYGNILKEAECERRKIVTNDVYFSRSCPSFNQVYLLVDEY